MCCYLPQFEDEFLTQVRVSDQYINTGPVVPVTQVKVQTSVNLLTATGLGFSLKKLHK